MPRGLEMPSFPRIPTGLPYIVFIFLLTLPLGVRGAAQNQPPKAAATPAGQVFPSAVPAPDQPEIPQTADAIGSSPKLGVWGLVDGRVYNTSAPARTNRGG